MHTHTHEKKRNLLVKLFDMLYNSNSISTRKGGVRREKQRSKEREREMPSMVHILSLATNLERI